MTKLNSSSQLPPPLPPPAPLTEQEIEDLQVQHWLRIYDPSVWDVMREDIRRQRLRKGR